MKGISKISKKLRKVENEDTKFIYKVNIGITGNQQTERAIDRYLQETLETYFCERGESVKFIEIESVSVI